ncbi:MAG: hypothetical protein HY689_02040 [Chloroflexi bacterium]|nr:hypothetical protein [Chloroflexota bacterium]
MLSTRHPETASPVLGDLLRPALLVAVLVEVAFLRLALRLGQALPPDERLGRVFSGLATLGLAAQNFAVLLGVAVLAGLCWRQVRLPGVRRRLSGALLLAAGLSTLGLALGPSSPGMMIAASLLAFVAMGTVWYTAPVLSGGRPSRRWLGLALVGYGALAYHYSAQAASSLGLAVAWTAPAYFVAEAAAVAAAVALVPLLRPRWQLSRAMAVSLLPAILLAALWVRPWTIASLTVWTFGFTLFLPAPVYALALWSFLYTVSALVRGGPEDRRLALGLTFIALAGLKLDYSYFALLALLGVGFYAAVGAAPGVPVGTAPDFVPAGRGLRRQRSATPASAPLQPEVTP